MSSKIKIIGGGLAGSEAAWQVAQRGWEVLLCEMRPHRKTEAHETEYLGELLCSNSLRSNDSENPHGLLKEEMRRLGSLLLSCADECAVPAGGALAVDREKFGALVTEKVKGHERIEVVREEVTSFEGEEDIVVASGPLTSGALAREIAKVTGEEQLYFYDAIAPIVDGESVNREKAYFAARWGKGGAEDYLNCPLTREEYDRFYEALIEGDKVPFRDFEEPRFFEGCMPIEEIARRGKESLAYGPFRPVGLKTPEGKRPYAVLQLRREDKEGRSYNLVGCQTRLKYGEQERIFRLIPGLEEVRFFRLGSMHRNTFLHSPGFLDSSLQCRKREGLYFAGQITGVEGYVESMASGLLAGLALVWRRESKEWIPPPPTTALGALIGYVTATETPDFQPMNINAGLFPPLEGKVKKKEKKKMLSLRALKDLEEWKSAMGIVAKNP